MSKLVLSLLLTIHLAPPLFADFKRVEPVCFNDPIKNNKKWKELYTFLTKKNLNILDLHSVKSSNLIKGKKKFINCFGLNKQKNFSDDHISETKILTYLLFDEIRNAKDIELFEKYLFSEVLMSSVQLSNALKVHITPLYFVVMEYLYFVSVIDTVKDAASKLKVLLNMCIMLCKKQAVWHPCQKKGSLSVELLKEELMIRGHKKKLEEASVEWLKKLSAETKKYFNSDLKIYSIKSRCKDCWLTCPHYP